MKALDWKVEYVVGKRELFDSIRPLWEKLNEHHKEKSKHFKCRFSNLSFDERMEKLLIKLSFGEIRVEIIKYNGAAVGYCITSISENGIGELESLYVETAYRGLQIGDELMRHALAWLDSKSVNIKRIGVTAGNKDILRFYEKYGFFTEYITLRQVK